MLEKDEGCAMFVVEVEDGEKRLYRIRLEPPAGGVASEYPNCVIAEWNFEDALPDKPLSDAHKAFETHMDPLGHNNRNSVLMHVYTKPGMKEWCYYARDYPAFMREVNTALAGKPRFPIEILHDTDPDWKYWTQVKDLVEARLACSRRRSARLIFLPQRTRRNAEDCNCRGLSKPSRSLTFLCAPLR